MMIRLSDTSIPSWALGARKPVLDTTGAAYLLIGVGSGAVPVLQRWRAEVAGRSVELWAGENVRPACSVLVGALGRARVGVRVGVVGPIGACLALRAAALGAGLEDDEFTAVSAGTGPLEVFCTHCRVATSAVVNVGETVVCVGCQRELVVIHHVSRRSGQFMGYQGNAEVMAP